MGTNPINWDHTGESFTLYVYQTEEKKYNTSFLVNKWWGPKCQTDFSFH